LALHQGDQIGRIFAYWVTVFFGGGRSATPCASPPPRPSTSESHCTIGRLFTLGSFCENYRNSTNSSPTFFRGKIFHMKWIGLHFGRLCHKRIWSP
jgi:hypothetical protein